MSYEEYLELTEDAPCTLCGSSLPEFGYGIDRLDPELGYVPGNCAPFCKLCNKIKSTLTLDVLLEHLGKIQAHLAKAPQS